MGTGAKTICWLCLVSKNCRFLEGMFFLINIMECLRQLGFAYVKRGMGHNTSDSMEMLDF